MPQKSGFFDTTVDDPREYPAREFAEYFARFIGNGVFSGGDKLKVTAAGKDMNVSVILGYGWINGYMYIVYDAPAYPAYPAGYHARPDRPYRVTFGHEYTCKKHTSHRAPRKSGSFTYPTHACSEWEHL